MIINLRYKSIIIIAVGSLHLIFFSCTSSRENQENNDHATGVSQNYLKLVKQYADTLILKGRDNYGAEKSPLFSATLDRQTHRLPEGAKLDTLKNLKRENWGIRNSDRSLTGANPMHHLNLYQTLYGLTQVTGNEKYAREADEALSWFFNNCQSETTGLMAWGEHMGWDFRKEQPIVGEDYHSEGTHEFFRPWVLWEKSFGLAPEACQKFALGLWNHQIGNQETGNFSRHAKYYEHDPDLNSHYPRHGGFIINTWGHALGHSPNNTLREGLKTLLNFYKNQRSKYSGAIPAETHYRSEGMLMWPHSNLSLAIDLHNGGKMMGNTLGEKMIRQASITDTVYLNLDHELGSDGRGFVKAANTNTLAPSDVRGQSRRVFTRLWATGYGEATDAQIANICMERYNQVEIDGYKSLILATADRYLKSEPNIDFPVYPGTLGNVIWAMLNAYELSGEDKYLTRAHHFAQRAMDMFFEDHSPLPRASTHHDHYEAITRGDTLMMALLRLWAVAEGKSADLNLVFSDR